MTVEQIDLEKLLQGYMKCFCFYYDKNRAVMAETLLISKQVYSNCAMYCDEMEKKKKNIYCHMGWDYT